METFLVLLTIDEGSTGYWWIPLPRACDVEFEVVIVCKSRWKNSPIAVDLSQHDTFVTLLYSVINFLVITIY